MQRLKDIASFIYGAGRETPSIMSPAVAARKKLFGPGRRGKFEPADLLEHLGDPGLLLGLGVGLPALGMTAAMRAGGRRGARSLVRELAPRTGQLFPNPDDLMGPELAQRLGVAGQKNLRALSAQEAGRVPGSIMRPERSGAGGFFPSQAGTTMTKEFGPAMRLTSGKAEGPVVPGMTPLAESLRRTSAPISREGQVTPEYEVLTDKVLDLGNLDKPLPQFGGRASRQILDEVRGTAEQQAQAFQRSEYGRPQTVPPRSAQSEFSEEMETPWTRPLGQNPYSELLSETPQQAAPGEHLVQPGTVSNVAEESPLGLRVPVKREDLPFMSIPTGKGRTVRGKPRTEAKYRELTGEDWPTEPMILGHSTTEGVPPSSTGGPFAQNAPGQSNIPHTAEFNVPDIEVPPGTEVQRQPTFEAFTGRASEPEASKIGALATELQNPGVKPTGEASEQFVGNALRQKLKKPGRVAKVPELQSIVQRFLAERNPRMSRELLPVTGTIPSQHAGAPLPKERGPWVREVLSGKRNLEPGQQRHLTLQEFDLYLDRAARAGTRASDLPIPGVDPQKQAAIGRVLRDELVPESQKAQEAGVSVTSTEELGSPTTEGTIPGEETLRSLSDSKLSPTEARKSLSKAMAETTNSPIPVKEQPSDLVVRRLPTDTGDQPQWLLPMQSKLQQAGQEVGSQWDAIARLRQVADLPPESRGLTFGKPKPALEELSKSPHLPKLLDRIDQGIDQALQKAPKEGFRPSPKFDEMMEWTKFLTPEGRANVLSRMEKKSPEAAKRLRHMWTQWQGGRQRPGGTPTRPSPSELVTRPGELARVRDVLPEKPKREDLVDILVDNRDEFIDWSQQRSPQLAAKAAAEDRALRGRTLQELLMEQGVQGIRRGEDVGFFSEHVLGAPRPPAPRVKIPIKPVGAGGLAGELGG